MMKREFMPGEKKATVSKTIRTVGWLTRGKVSKEIDWGGQRLQGGQPPGQMGGRPLKKKEKNILYWNLA